MKYLRLALIASVFAACELHAQRGEPEPIPDFSNLDEYIYEPKTTLILGLRSIGGAKTSIRGTGTISEPRETIGKDTEGNIFRIYHDGSLQPDARFTTTDNGDGTSSFTPVSPDGKTNTWSFVNDKQATEFPGYIAMHSYSAAVTDTTIRIKDSAKSIGMELAVARDMGKVFNTRLQWTLMAGVSINDLSAKNTDKVRADLTTITDLYSLYGEVAPTGPYQAPSQSTTTITDSSGNPVLNPDGSTQTVTTDTTILLGNTPVERRTSVISDGDRVTNRSKLRGAYYTFRAGPTLWVPISTRFRASVSVGATLIYAGSNFQVEQIFQPESGAEITNQSSSDDSQFLPGFFGDATLQFDVTPRTGFYAGAVFQSAGDYSQSVNSATANYTTKVEFGNQHGFRAGMTVKF